MNRKAVPQRRCEPAATIDLPPEVQMPLKPKRHNARESAERK